MRFNKPDIKTDSSWKKWITISCSARGNRNDSLWANIFKPLRILRIHIVGPQEDPGL